MKILLEINIDSHCKFKMTKYDDDRIATNFSGDQFGFVNQFRNISTNKIDKTTVIKSTILRLEKAKKSTTWGSQNSHRSINLMLKALNNELQPKLFRL